MGKSAIIVQARTGSTRLPQKMTLEFGGVTVLEFILQRLKNVDEVGQVILATTVDAGDDILEKIAGKMQIPVYRGSVNNVLDRFYQTAVKYDVDIIIRICADNIFLEISEFPRLLKLMQVEKYDYLANSLLDGKNLILTGTGLAVEMISFDAISKLVESNIDNYHREHVTPYFYENADKFNIHLSPVPFAVNKDMRLTLDLAEDYENLQIIYSSIVPDINITAINHYLENNPSMLETMRNISLQQKKGR